MSSPHSLPLRWHLVRLALGTLLPVVVFAVVVAFQLARSEREASERRLVRSARMLALNLDLELSGSIRVLQALGESEHLERGELGAFRTECERVLRTQSSWKLVLLIAPDGRQLVNTGLARSTPLPALSESESFTRVVETQQPTVGSLARGGKGMLAFPVRVPVMRGGVLQYVLTAVITPEALSSVVVRQASDAEEWTRTLIDQRGLVAARTRDPERFVGQLATPLFLEHSQAANEGVFVNTSMEGVRVHVAFSRSRLSGWTAGVSSPTWLLDAPVTRSMLTVGGLGLSLLLVSVGGAWIFSQRIERSITQASAAANALARGESPHMESSSVRELAGLGEALERSGQLLRERERERDANLAAVESARTEAVAATQAKDAFLAMLGHELRNPLAPIVTSMELLRRRGLAGSPEHEVISRQLRHVVRLVDDLLDVARITRGQMSLRREPLELPSAISRAVEAVTPLLEQRRHTLELDVPASGLWVLGDADRLTQVVANLLTNAAKYTSPGGRIRVRAHEHEGGITLVVADNGPGLPPDLLPRLFEPFVQGPRTLDRSEGGLGIGLALVRRLVEAHGGRVEPHSDGPGRGSTFTVWLPKHVRTEAPPLVEARREPAPLPIEVVPESRTRVLLVDDNVDAAEGLADLLRMSGYEVVVAHDCPEALARAEACRPHVAILDIGLPDVDGYGVAERLRERLGEESPVFAALTGYSQDGDRTRSQAAGFRHHFVKPVDIDDLLAFLGTVHPASRVVA